MARKVWFVRLAAFMAAVALMLSASFGNIEFLNTTARAEEETGLQTAEEAAPQETEAEEETELQATEEAAPQETEAEEETALQAAEEAAPQETEAEEETEPETVTAPEDHQEEAQPETAADDENDEIGDDQEWIDDKEETVDPEENEDLAVIDDDDAGTVSEEILDPFNNPELYEQEAFAGTAEIRLMNEGMLSYGDEIILRADVRDVNVTYRLVWEANDNDGRGWFTVGSGEEYRFVLDRENAAREYRVEIFAVD